MEFSEDFIVQQTVMIETELAKHKYGKEEEDIWLGGATLFVKEILPLVLLKQPNTKTRKLMLDGIIYLATHTRWLLELNEKDWSNAKR